jgi:hypothetical protein
VRLTETQAAALGHYPVLARAVLKQPDMNKTEARYAATLELQQKAGEILWWKFEAITFKLADDCRYTPDFVVMMPDGMIELRETKGFWRDDALVKIRVAAAQFPFRFRSFQLDRKTHRWIERAF